MINQLVKKDSSIDLSQRTRQLEERLVDPQSNICIDSLLDGIVALIYDSEGLKKTKNFDTFFSRFNSSTREIRDKRIRPNDFQTIKILGRGAFGTVDLVRRKQTGEVYAMKTLSKFEMLKKSDTAFFWEERNIMAFANSDWIVKLHYAFQDAKNLYMIMDYMPGGDLITLITRYDIDEKAARFYCAEIILAIDAVHKMGYVHRDVKPDNLLLDSRGHLKLADFGTCVKMDDKKQVRSDTAIGTPDYISPEILKSQSQLAVYGCEVDWWSVGVVFYEMIYGETPFYEESLVGTYNKIMKHQTFLTFPPDTPISPESKNLICDFLSDASVRLGKNGINEIKRHPCFTSQTDWTWETIRRVLPPVVPKISRDDDTSNFDEIEPEERPSQESFTTSKTFAGNQLAFIGFSYSNEQQPFSDRCLVTTFGNDIEQRLDESERTKHDLEQRIRRLQDDLNSKCQDEQMLNNKCFELERKIVVLTSEAKEVQRKYDNEFENRRKLENQLSNVNVSSDQESRQSTEKIISLERRIINLEQDLNDKIAANREFKLHNEQLEKSSRQYERTHEEIHNKFEEMLNQKLKLEKDLQHQQNLLEQERLLKHKTNDKLQELQDEYQHLSHEYSKLKSQDAFHRQELVDLEGTIATFEQEKFQLQDEIDSLRTDLSNNELAYRQLQEKMLSNKVQRNENFNREEEYQKIVRDLENKLQNERETLKKTHDELVQSQKQCRLIEIDLKEMTTNVHQLTEQNQSDEQRRKEFEQKIRTIEEKLEKSLLREEELMNDLKEKEKENEDLKVQQKINVEKCQNLQMKLKEFEQKTKTSKESTDRTSEQMSEMKIQIKQLTEKLRHEEKERSKLIGQIETLTQKSKTENERFHRLEEQNGQLEKDKQIMMIEAEAVHKDFQVRLGLLDAQINTVRDQYEKARQDFEQTNKDRQTLDNEYHHVLDQLYNFERETSELRKRVESERTNKEAVLKKLEEVMKNPSRTATFRHTKHDRDRSERNLVRRLEQSLEEERTKYRNLQNEKDELVNQLTEEINALKHKLENQQEDKKIDVKVPRPIQRTMSTDRIKGWIETPTRNLRKGGWKRYYAIMTETKFLLCNTEKGDQVTISINFEQFYHVRPVTQGDVHRVPAHLLTRIIQILYDSQGQISTSNSSATLPSRINTTQESNSHHIEYKGHQFLVVTYRKAAECEVCNRPCYSIFTPPACLECTRCKMRCHKSHYDNRDDPIPSCRIFDDFTGKDLIILCETESERDRWLNHLRMKIKRRPSRSHFEPPPTLSSDRTTTNGSGVYEF